MNRLATLVFALAMLALPTAAAQVPNGSPTTVTLKIDPFLQPIGENGTAALHIGVTYSYTLLGEVAFAGTPIHLKVTAAPVWIVAAISPATMYAPVDGQAPSEIQTDVMHTTLYLALAHGAPTGETGTIKIEATADPNGLNLGSSADDQTIVRSAGGCAASQSATTNATAPAPGTPGASSRATSSFESPEARAPMTARAPLATQSAEGSAFAFGTPQLVVIGFAALGAVAGFALKRRLR